MPTHALAIPTESIHADGFILGAKGIDYGDMGKLVSDGKIRIADGMPQFIDDWDTILLAYANYKVDHEDCKIADLFKEWGIPEHHHRWFNDSRSRFRIMNYMQGGIA